MEESSEMDRVLARLDQLRKADRDAHTPAADSDKWLLEHFCITPEREDLEVFYESTRKMQLLVWHGPRQSGKTFRMNALRQLLTVTGKKVQCLDLQDAHHIDIELLRTLHSTCDVLLIDNFDALKHHRARSDYLACLRSLHSGATLRWSEGCRSTICFSTFAGTHLSTDIGSPFNVSTRRAATPFTLVEVSALFRQFAEDWHTLVPDDVVVNIYDLTAGHRGLVAYAGETMQEHLAHALLSCTLEDWQGMRLAFDSKVRGSPLFTHIAAALHDTDRRDINTVVSALRAREQMWLSEFGGRTASGGRVPDLVYLLADVGLVQLNDDGSSYQLGPPVLVDLWLASSGMSA